MLSIGAFSKITNVTTKTLRYYDEIGLLKPICVDPDSGYRYYDVAQLKTVLLITKLKRYFFSLSEIASVIDQNGNCDLLAMFRRKDREIQTHIDSFERIRTEIEKDLIYLERGIHIMAYLDKIEIKLVETQSKNILSLRQKMDVNEYGKYIGILFERITREKLTVAGGPMTIYYDEEFDPENYDTEIAVPIRETVAGTRILPGCLCAMATLKGPYSGLTSIYTKLKQWTEAERYRISGAPFEIYLTNPAETKPEEYITEVYFPVKK
ncbi:MAG: MerR family transcriptional regulator [Clostridia bacterium]